MNQVKETLVMYNKSINDDYAIMINSNKGISPLVFDDIVNMSGIGRLYLAENIFDMSLKTIMRYQKENKLLSARSSEVALKVLHLIKVGIGIFGTTESFKAWINKPAYGLGGAIPLHLMNTITGIDLIKEELLRIEHGALA